MDPIDERELLLTRRHFFGRSAPGSESRLSLLCCRRLTLKDDAASPRACRISRPKPSASSICSNMARLRSSIFSTTSPSLQRLRGTDLPESIRMGQRLTGMTAVSGQVSDRAVHLQVRAARRNAALVERTAAAHCQSRRRPCSSSRCTPKRSTTIPPSRSFRPAFSSPVGRVSARGSLMGWEAKIKDLPAFVVMVSQGAGNAQALADRHVGQWLSADEVSGRQIPLRSRPGAVSFESARLSMPRRGAIFWMISRS